MCPTTAFTKRFEPMSTWTFAANSTKRHRAKTGPCCKLHILAGATAKKKETPCAPGQPGPAPPANARKGGRTHARPVP